MQTHAGSNIRESSDAPDRYKTYEVSQAMVALVANNRTTVAGGV